MLVTKSCLTLCDPLDCSPPGSDVHGILQARILEWVAIFFQETFPIQGLNPGLPNCRQILYHLSHHESPIFIYLATFSLSCGIWDQIRDLIPRSGIKSRPHALGVQSLSHWTSREILFKKNLLAILRGMWDLSFQTRDGNHTPCLGSVAS